MFTTTRKSIAAALFACAMLSLTACGGNVQNVLKDAEISLAEQSGEKVVSFMTELDTKDMLISAAALPIAKGLGTLEVLSDINTQKTYLKLTFKLGKALKLPSFQYLSKMPNGVTVPLADINLSKMMAFDVGTTGSKIYLYYDAAAKKSVLGVALNVEALAIGTPAILLKSFQLGNVTGVAGLYFGEKANTSGLGIFADLSGVFSGVLAEDEIHLMARQPVRFVERKATKEQQELVDRKLYKLSTSKTRIVVK